MEAWTRTKVRGNGMVASTQLGSSLLATVQRAFSFAGAWLDHVALAGGRTRAVANLYIKNKM
jgi:hypothetical protein